MSDHAIILVCRAAQPYRTAAKVIAQLVAKQIVEPMPTDCVLAALGHPPGPRAGDIVDDLGFLRLAVNGVEIRLTRHVQLFSEGDELPAVSCPRCGRDLEEETLFDHLGPPNPFAPRKLVTCPGCGEARPIDEWTPHATSAFGNLAFAFWNWPPLRPSFVSEVEAWCGAPLTMLHEHV